MRSFLLENEIQWIDFMGSGQWTLMDDLQATYQINLIQGTLITNDFDLETGRIYMVSYPVDFRKHLDLGNSHIRLKDAFANEQIYIASNNFTIDPGNSLVEFVSPDAAITHYGDTDITLHDVLFSNSGGRSRIEQWDQGNLIANKLQFNNSALILNPNTMDSLLLAAGKEYELESGATQTMLTEKQERAELAVKFYEMYLDEYPIMHGSHYILGLANLTKNDTMGAIRSFEASLKLHPYNPYVKNQIDRLQGRID
ncbi:MAG: hypothetical protein OEM26_05635 [Saprospiraceae bacterium]|nr:hypothetical protein [Saprospiraceae bacterium]